MRINGFQGNGKFYKGNFHCHTTISDGKLSPEETVRVYASKGYDFMAITDHKIYNALTKIGDEPMLIIPGTELDCQFKKQVGDMIIDATHHMVCLDPGKNFPGEPCAQGQRFQPVKVADSTEAYRLMRDQLKDRRFVGIYCHPDWSRVELQELLPLEGLAAMEVFNSESNICGDVGGTTTYWDSLLRRGSKILAVASDDSHNLSTMGKGWIQVKAEELTQESIMENFLKGNFYASTGPEIYDFYVEDNKLHVECSPCRKIHLVRFFRTGSTAYDENGGLLTSATIPFNPEDLKYIRVVCEDAEGNRAWSNPIFF